MNTIQSIDLTGVQFKKHRVLLVEDSQESEALMRNICEAVDNNMKLKCVKTAEEAQHLLQANSNFDLIIADHFLAGQKTGLDLWRNCQEEFGQIPFMMTSSLTNEEFVQKAEHDWSHPFFLHKPFSKRDCQQMIEWFLNRKPISFQNQLETKSTPKIVLEKIFRLWGAVTFMALLIVSTQIKSGKNMSTEKSYEFNNFQPLKISIENEEREKNVAKFNDVFTPDLLSKITGIKKRADEINEIFKETTRNGDLPIDTE